MKNINVLDVSVANLIAAGEVVERPASVVKELVENAIDAGADKISVSIRNGGITSIIVTDNGSGIEREDVPYAFLPHATSKIRASEDLAAIGTLGFRGEALASIAAVSRLRVTTKVASDELGSYMEMEAGELSDIYDMGAADGTTIAVEDLFFNTPARMKFLKRDATEGGYIGDILTRYALGYPDISFKFEENGKVKFVTPGNNSLRDCFYILYGKEYSDNCREVQMSNEYASAKGLIVSPNVVRKNSNFQSFFVNRRYIKSVLLQTAVKEAYKEKIVAGNFPVFCLNVEINPALVDVNVHPSKLEVKFSNEREVFNAIYWGVKNALAEKAVYEMEFPINQNSENFAEASKESMKEDNMLRDAADIPYTFAPKEKAVSQTGFEKELQPAKKKNWNIEQPSNFEITQVFESKTFESEAENKQEFKPREALEKKTEQIRMREEEALEIPYRIIGQLFHTYILVEQGEELLLIDQHAAHERLNFERLKKQYEQKDAFSQMLLSPVIIDFTTIEHAKVMEQLEFLRQIGFETEDFGGNCVAVRSAPQGIDTARLKELFLEVVELLASRASAKEIVEDALHMVACKASVRANDALSPEEMKALLRDALALKEANTCPHGRPFVLHMSKKEIEKGFLRIV